MKNIYINRKKEKGKEKKIISSEMKNYTLFRFRVFTDLSFIGELLIKLSFYGLLLLYLNL